MVFQVKSRRIKEMTLREDKGSVHSFYSFIYSLPTQQDCVLPVCKVSQDETNDINFMSF